METSDIVEYFAQASGILFACTWLFQIYKIHKTKRTRDLSFKMLICIITAIIFGMVYSVYHNIKSLYIPSAFTAVCVIDVIILKIWFDKKNQNTEQLANEMV